MSYIPTIWSNGSKITAAKLNKLEQGIVDSGNSEALILTPSTILNTTYNEIKETYLSGINVIYYEDDNGERYQMLSGMYATGGNYTCIFNMATFNASSPFEHLTENIEEDM